MGVEYRDLTDLGHPGYRVGDDGSVWSERRKGEWRQCRPSLVDGRPRVSLRRAARTGYKGWSVAILVLTAFDVAKPDGAVIVGYQDGNPANCALDNLFWAKKTRLGGGRGKHRDAPPDTTLRGAVARTVTRRRADLDITVREAAERAQMTADRWYEMEFGSGALTIDTLLRACVGLGCEPADLLPPAWREMVASA